MKIYTMSLNLTFKFLFLHAAIFLNSAFNIFIILYLKRKQTKKHLFSQT